MTGMTTLPRSRPLTRADLEAMPDDGHRYELIDGVLVEVATASGDEEFAVSEPLEVRFTPRDLIR